MVYNWENSSAEVNMFVHHLLDSTKDILDDKLIGFYIHGSLAMGGFNPSKSDIDILVVTTDSLSMEIKKRLLKLFLECSNNPFPAEVTFLNEGQLKEWKYPTPFDFHYSEHWRKKYEEGAAFVSDMPKEDPDLAAHITIVNHRGICLWGRSIDKVFPAVPKSHYLASILFDYEDCLKNIELNPVYCTLNLVRVYCYLKEEKITSKQEAGKWGLSHLPQAFHSTRPYNKLSQLMQARSRILL
ncbi:aminoglycoside adenylyltransferase domain-containing protein [Bacillus sp. FJAT-22090]|uniref:aminoglycoside adenylyltransferase domain-containing protein n=1 Tax=Bacillus sp. FJAT-22090 TaxID=1581038 RepID=UPI0011A798FE|nr:aminoglycoside adenylyltransferase domain-containing protein [Bacillus sp. FJAT-22090]